MTFEPSMCVCVHVCVCVCVCVRVYVYVCVPAYASVDNRRGHISDPIARVKLQHRSMASGANSGGRGDSSQGAYRRCDAGWHALATGHPVRRVDGTCLRPCVR